MTSSSKDSYISSGTGIFIRDKNALTISFALLGVAAISWIASYYLMPIMMMSGSTPDMTVMMMANTGLAAIVSSSFPLSTPAIVLFEVVWIVGMMAMMFPAMIPIVLFYNKVSSKLALKTRLARMVGTPLFLSGYLVAYGILGLGAYLSVYFALNLSMLFSSGLLLSVFSVIAPAAILVATGVYQFTPLKFKCLSGCVSPIGFFATKSQKGLFGSIRMGFSHGVYCVGCCVLYMLVMLVVGAMSIPIMALLAGVIALEKVIVRGSVWFGRIVGFAFILSGIMVLAFPNLLMLVQ